MKHYILSLLAAATLLFFYSCDLDDPIIDYVPVVWNVVALDAEGNNLFDPDYEGNIIAETTVTYDGETYNILDGLHNDPNVQSRAYLARFHNPYVGTDFRSGGTTPILYIGEWNGDGHWDNETVVINWPGGTQSTLSFTLTKPGWTEADYFIDGQKTKSPIVRFVRRDNHFEVKK